MKRVFSILMICALLLAGLAAFVSAEGTAPSLAITVDQTAVKEGETVTATVNALNYTANTWSAMTVKVTYDPAYLSFDKETGVLGNAALEDIQTVVADVKNGEGTILINWISSDGVPAADYLVQLQFTALAETTNAIISAGFTPDGQAELGSEEPIVNTDGSAFSSAEVESAPIEVQPEEDPDQPQDPEEPASNKATITTNKAPGNEVKIDVGSEYIDESRDSHAYKVGLSWNDLAVFTFIDADTNEWNTKTHKWDVSESGAWSVKEATLTVNIENHSSQDVKASLSYKDTEGGAETALKAAVEDVTVNKATVNEANVENPDGTKGAISGTVTVDGRITEEEAGILGIFTVTIS